MKRNILTLVGGLMLMSLSGCVTAMLTEQAANQATPPTVENFSFDISTPGADAGTLMLQTRQPSYQLSVAKYAIKIDTNAPLVVSKQSDVTVKLDAGKHSLKLYATSSDPTECEKVTYGRANTKEIVVTKDQELNLKYTGPYRLLGSGTVKEID
ncbi:MAG TPA: hypothetical protein VMH87_07210 [Pseudomonadales bacterium]|nr:hypothetical protein [Pseudomonadales bacterium]